MFMLNVKCVYIINYIRSKNKKPFFVLHIHTCTTKMYIYTLQLLMSNPFEPFAAAGLDSIFFERAAL